ncbi:MAG: hypothetical protein JWM66_1544 [Solirubrobacterales bacterium]|nr:hypothetical protein [Solirubrobacterales bacterium]
MVADGTRGRVARVLLLGTLAFALVALCASLADGLKQSNAARSAATKRSAPSARRTAAGGDCSQQFGSFSIGRWPPSCWRPYGSRSPFNTPIPANARVSPESSAIVRYFVDHGSAFDPDKRGNLTLHADGSRPVYWSRSSDPLVKVRCRGGGSCQRGMRVHVPAGARPQQQSDAHMTIIDQAEGREYDFWRASTPEHATMTVTAGSSIAIGVGSGTGRGGVAEAAGLGLAGGLIRGAELSSGRIDHALATTVSCVQMHDVWPSPQGGRGDAVCPGGAGPHLGSLLQLDMSEAEIAATRAPAWERAVMAAMSRYGVYVVDTNGGHQTQLSLIHEDDLSFTAFGYPGPLQQLVQALGRYGTATGIPIPVSRLRVIMPCVPRGTC